MSSLLNLPESLDPSKPEASMLLNLPEEVHNEIFLRAPAESVLSCRCVCKLFNNLLSKPSFIKNHVNRTIQTKNYKPKLLFGNFFKEESIYSAAVGDPSPKIYSLPIDYDSISSSCECRGAVPINYPFESHKRYWKSFLGSVNGLICLNIECFKPIPSRDGVPSFRYEQNFCILNPLTGEYKNFTTRPDIRRTSLGVFGFYYDSDIDDYKLVMISDYERNNCHKTEVYTMKSDSWTSIHGTVDTFYTCRRFCGVFSNGCVHWLGNTSTRSEVIVSFDVRNETMVSMPFPEDVMPPTEYSGEVHRNIGVWGDCLCIACIWGSDRIDVWVMEEYGVKESWTKRFTTTIKLSGSSNPYWKPLWCFENGEILVDNGGEQLHLYDPTNERVRSVVVGGITMDRNRENYVESLVSLGSGTYLEKWSTGGIVKHLERLDVYEGCLSDEEEKIGRVAMRFV